MVIIKHQYSIVLITPNLYPENGSEVTTHSSARTKTGASTVTGDSNGNFMKSSSFDKK